MDAVLTEILAEPSQIAGNPEQITPEQPLTGQERIAKHYFTKANAKAMSDKAHKLRQERLEQLRLSADPARQSDDHYRLASLARTRGLIAKLELELEQCSVPQASHYLVSSIAKLRDAEQKLANRPLPGSRRPGRESASKAPSTYEPSE